MKSLLFIQLVVVFGLVNADPIGGNPSVKMEFAKFQQRFGKEYFNLFEKEKRMAIFEETYLEVQRHNAKPNVSFLMGINQFSDLTQKEFADAYLNLKLDERPTSYRDDDSCDCNCDNTNSNGVDWRTKKNILTSVKNQGSCGSCWAFAEVQQIESYYALKGGNLTELSPQHLVSCAGKENGANGCNGANPYKAYGFVKANGGITSEKDYPYEAKEKCCPKKNNVVKIGGMKIMYKNNDEELFRKHLENTGPLYVAINASPLGFQHYKNGIFDASCPTNINHAVQLVGWGKEGKKKYWIVRNSWGPYWGDKGYIRMEMDGSNKGKCGILTYGSYPTEVVAA